MISKRSRAVAGLVFMFASSMTTTSQAQQQPAAFTAAPQPPPPPSQPNYYLNFHNYYIQRGFTPNVMFLGDSYVDRWGETPYLGNAGNPIYDKTLDGNAGYNVVVTKDFVASWQGRIAHFGAYNFGISGDKAENVLWRIQPQPQLGQQGEFDGTRLAKVIVLLVGLNNIEYDLNNPQLNNPPLDTALTIKAIVDTIHAKSSNTRVLILNVLPAFPAASGNVTPATVEARRLTVNAAVNEQVNAQVFSSRGTPGYGSGDYIVDVSPYFAPNGAMKASLYYSDSVHPSPLGYQVLAGAIATPIRQMLRRTVVPNDFDGDGHSDIGVYDRATAQWCIFLTGINQQAIYQWGNSTTIPAPADFDGDGVTDLCVYDPSTGNWYILKSDSLANPTAPGSTQGFPTAITYAWGTSTCIPVPADYDGDGKADISVYDQSTGIWATEYSGGGASTFVQFGNGSRIPVPADYDGDGKADIAGLDRTAGIYYINRSTAGATSVNWGNSSIVPAPQDNDGDGVDELAGFDPAGPVFYDWRITPGPTNFTWGNLSSTPVPGDYDGDGRSDWALFDAASATWTIQYTSNNKVATVPFGGTGNGWMSLNSTPLIRTLVSRLALP